MYNLFEEPKTKMIKIFEVEERKRLYFYKI